MRDLDADLKICEAADPAPIRITPCKCGYEKCNQVFISMTNSEGRLYPEDAKFIKEARIGWPEAIKRAKEAEEKVDRLVNEIRMIQDDLNRKGCGV